MVEHGCHDAYLLLVSCRIVAYELLLAHNLAAHETLHLVKTLAHGVVVDAAHLGYELEIFFGQEKVDKKTVVNIGTRVSLPIFHLGRVYGYGICRVARSLRLLVGVGAKSEIHISVVCFQQVEHETEHGRFACAVVANKTYDLSIVNMQAVYVYSHVVVERFLQLAYCYLHFLFPFVYCVLKQCFF